MSNERYVAKSSVNSFINEAFYTTDYIFKQVLSPLALSSTSENFTVVCYRMHRLDTNGKITTVVNTIPNSTVLSDLIPKRVELIGVGFNPIGMESWSLYKFRYKSKYYDLSKIKREKSYLINIICRSVSLIVQRWVTYCETADMPHQAREDKQRTSIKILNADFSGQSDLCTTRNNCTKICFLLVTMCQTKMRFVSVPLCYKRE